MTITIIDIIIIIQSIWCLNSEAESNKFIPKPIPASISV